MTGKFESDLRKNHAQTQRQAKIVITAPAAKIKKAVQNLQG